MARALHTILVTGGCGFIGSNFIRYLFSRTPDNEAAFSDAGFAGTIVNVDSLTYAGNPANLAQVQAEFGGTRYFFEKADITDRPQMERIFRQYGVDTVVHFAAESHVDRSILGPEAFVKTNVNGTFTLLDVARDFWGCSLSHPRDDVLFHHVSTDEVYGSLGATGYFTEQTPYAPRSPYSASKAASDHLAMAYHHTYALPVTLSNCSNNYGPYQFPEKLIPLMVLNMTQKKPLPVYGEGKNIRDWVYVGDHNRAVWRILNQGVAGQKYNIGGENEWQNITLLDTLIGIVCQKTGLRQQDVRATITHVADRPGHDARYAIDCSKIQAELGWRRLMTFEQGLSLTVDWYLGNAQWVSDVQSGAYRTWIEKNYGDRL